MILGERGRIISALGLVEILTWGSSYYLLAVLAGPIKAETGWSTGTITAGISLALLASGAAARPVGRRIGAEGGRRVMAGGILLLALGLMILGMARSLPVYFLAWGLLGLGMAGSLYDAAFSTLGRIFGSKARPAITAITLWGGFASTICWPISALVVENFGWRAACFFYAAVHLFITLPLCRFALPRVPPEHETQELTPPKPRKSRDLRFLCIAVAGATLSMITSLWATHLITILTAEGYALAAAVGLGTLIGPAQVGARALEMASRGRHHPIWTMIAATSLVLLGFVGLVLDMPAGAALAAYGAGNGLWSIARGALPLALFGPRDYPAIMGRLAAPMLVAAALAPLIGGALLDGFGSRAVLILLTVSAMLPCAAAATLWAITRSERHDAVAGL